MRVLIAPRLRIGQRIVSLQQALGAQVNELQQALSSVRALSGLLPIRAYCKRIRDDKSYWTQMDHYLSVHSDARFGHGICPDCLVKHANENCRIGRRCREANHWQWRHLVQSQRSLGTAGGTSDTSESMSKSDEGRETS